jgi:WD40 repeat protein
VQAIVDDCLARRMAGEVITDDSIVADNPDLLPELEAALRHVQLVQAACRAAEQNDAASIENGSPRAASAADSSLTVRCPHCHSPMPLAGDASLSSLTCSACGNSFSLIEDGADEVHLTGAFGHFQILRELGSGGFGSVHQARDSQLDRVVALKIPRRGQLTAAEADQFLREARTAAQLRHPNIISVLEVGRQDETFYIVSEFIDGESLAARLARQPLTAREAAAMCQKLAAALHHAHQSGIVHRDLKPANVLIDSAGEPHITDFGLARREMGEVTMTMDGVVVGTPAYMPPEQARGQSHTADRRSDVYSLGVIFFELLTGELPFRGNVRMVTQQILNEEPPNPRKLNATIPRDLETITLKCLEKDPAGRYATAQDLSDDLGRFLRHEPIIARPVGRLERTWRWCHRNPRIAGLSATVAALLLLVAAMTTYSSIHSRAAARAARWQQYLSDMHAAMKAWDEGDVGRVVDLLQRNQPRPGEEDLRRFEWFHLWGQCQPSLNAPTLQHADGVTAVALTSDGSKLLAGTRSSASDVLCMWDVDRQAKLHAITGPGAFWVKNIAVSPDDSWFASVGVDQAVRLWNLATCSPLHIIRKHSSFTIGVAISPDGNLVATGSTDGTVKIWDAKTAELVHSFEDSTTTFHQVKFTPDGQMLAAAADDGGVRLWNVGTHQLAHSIQAHAGPVYTIVFFGDGSILASAGRDGIIRFWNVHDGSSRGSCIGHTSSIRDLDISPDGDSLASAGGRDGTVRVWETATGTELRAIRGHAASVDAVRFLGNDRLVSGGSDGAVRIWNLGEHRDADVLRSDGGQTWSLAVVPDGRTAYAGSYDGAVRAWNLETGALISRNGVEKGNGIDALAMSPDGTRLALGGNGTGTIDLWNLVTGETNRFRKDGHPVTSLCWTTDGRTLVSSDTGKQVILWNALDGTERSRLLGHEHWVCSAAISPDDSTLVTRCEDNTLRIWELATGKLLKAIEMPAYFFSPVAFSRDGALLACVGTDQVIQLRETVGWEVVRTAAGHTNHVKSLVFSPDEVTLASASDDGTIRLWEVATGEQRCVFRGHLGEVECVKFTPDGQTLLSSGQDGTVRIWRAAK